MLGGIHDALPQVRLVAGGARSLSRLRPVFAQQLMILCKPEPRPLEQSCNLFAGPGSFRVGRTATWTSSTRTT